ncbi:TPA: ATP-dependent Clp protease adaptor ClpS, partial [Escherichia coli]
MSNYENEREKLNFPTYIIAAEWALRTGNLLTVDVLMNEFSITQAQANDIIYKIRNEGRCVYEKVVVFKSRP